jgi:quinol monooxygenase YgiN
MVVIAVNFEVKPDKVAEFKEVITGHSKRTLEREPGCRQFDVSQDPKNAQRFFLYEVYNDEAAFEAHRNSPHMAETGKKIPDLILSRKLEIFSMVPAGAPKR